MLENLKITCNIMLPLVIYMVIGALGKKTGLFKQDFLKSNNKFMSALLLPMMAYNSMAKADLSGLRSGSSVVKYVAIATLLAIPMLMFIAKFIEKDIKKRASMVHCSIRGNSMIYALPVATAIYGADNVGEIAMVLAVEVAIYNVTFVLLLEYYRSLGESAPGDFKGQAGKLIKKGFISCCKNHILQGVVIGLIVNILHIELPSAINDCITTLAGMAVPVSFIIMGVALNVTSLKANRRDVLIASAIKLVILPGCAIILPLIWGWRGTTFAAAFLCFSTSSASSSYPMSEALGADGELAGEIVMISALLSVVTMFTWIFCFKQFGIL